MQALSWGDMNLWQVARQKCSKFRSNLKQKLDKGDSAAQEFNRVHVVPLGLVVNTAVFGNADKP